MLIHAPSACLPACLPHLVPLPLVQIQDLLLDLVHDQRVGGLRADGGAHDGHQAVRRALHVLVPAQMYTVGEKLNNSSCKKANLSDESYLFETLTLAPDSALISASFAP